MPKAADFTEGDHAEGVNLLTFVTDALLQGVDVFRHRTVRGAAADEHELHQHGLPLRPTEGTGQLFRSFRHRRAFIRSAAQRFFAERRPIFSRHPRDPFAIRGAHLRPVHQIDCVQKLIRQGRVVRALFEQRFDLRTAALADTLPGIRQQPGHRAVQRCPFLSRKLIQVAFQGLVPGIRNILRQSIDSLITALRAESGIREITLPSQAHEKQRGSEQKHDDQHDPGDSRFPLDPFGFCAYYGFIFHKEVPII